GLRDRPVRSSRTWAAPANAGACGAAIGCERNNSSMLHHKEHSFPTVVTDRPGKALTEHNIPAVPSATDVMPDQQHRGSTPILDAMTSYMSPLPRAEPRR